MSAAKFRRWVLAAAWLVGVSIPSAAADLTALEQRWLKGAWPVLQHAKASGLPLDVVVQPQNADGLAPLAMAFIDGRCKLVLSTRGNAAAQTMLDTVAPELHDAALELMAAHELGHCLRHMSGRWQVRPLNFAPSYPIALSDAQRVDYAQMQATRLEEGFADLAGLAWIRHARPAQYTPLYRWLVRERVSELLPGSHHDTLAWLRLVEDPNALAGETPFARVTDLWLVGVEQVGAGRADLAQADPRR
jgi:hypothetical protein